MDILILIIIIIILLLVISNFSLLMHIISNLPTEKPVVQEEAKVTDPFQKPKEIYSSTSHIVVPKTPTEIRNQNFKKIKDGVEYGDIRRD